MSYPRTVSDIMDIIQKGYGDASQTALDYKVATDIVAYLSNNGWMSSGEAAILVESAGGEIIVPEDVITGSLVDNLTLYSQQEPMSGGWIFRTRRVKRENSGSTN